jgi:hypothetical protein
VALEMLLYESMGRRREMEEAYFRGCIIFEESFPKAALAKEPAFEMFQRLYYHVYQLRYGTNFVQSFQDLYQIS